VTSTEASKGLTGLLSSRLAGPLDRWFSVSEKESGIDLVHWRNRILSISLVGGVILALFAFIPSLVLLFHEGLWILAGLATIVYATAVALLLGTRLEYRVRALGTSFILYLMGLAIILYRGPFTGGPVWLFLFGSSMGLFLGLRGALWGLIINALTIIGLGFLVRTGLPSWSPVINNSLTNWIIAGCLFVPLNAVASVSIAALIQILESALIRERKAATALEREVGERRKAQEALKTSERKLSEITNTIPGVVFQLTRPKEGPVRFSYVSGRSLDYFGHEPEKVMADPLVIFSQILPEDRKAVTKAIEKSIREGGEFKAECRIRRPDGEIMWLQAVSGSTGLPGGGRLWNGVILDITDRKEAEAALRMSEKKFRSLYSAMVDGVCLHELIRNKEGRAVDYRILDFNPAYEQLTGFDRAKTVGARASELYGTDEPPYLGVFARVAETGEPVTFESHFPPLEKNFSISAFSPAADQFATVFTDITEQKRAEADRIKLENQLRQAQKMEAVGTLAAGISHDFNNILAAILGYTELAMSDLANDDPARTSLGQVIKAGRKARGLIEQIMSFSRPEGRKFKPILLGPLVDEALDLIRTTVPEGVAIKSRIDPESEPIMADPDQIHQLLINLATNAVHAMRVEGGVLSVILEPVSLGPEETANLPGLEPGAYEKLTVSDTGPGIAQEHLERIFEPFFTTKGSGQGTGLGLAVVHGIVNSHGGAVKVSNRSGRGTVFEVFLPSAVDAAEEEVELEGAPLPKGSGRVLFIDDDPSLVDSCLQTLTKLGYTTTARTSSQEGLEVFRKKPQGFDLVITDLIMPEMNGVKMAKEMLSLRPDLPIILCTGFSDQITEEMARDIGFRRFLLKPLVARELAQAIKEVLEGNGQRRHLRLVSQGGGKQHS